MFADRKKRFAEPFKVSFLVFPRFLAFAIKPIQYDWEPDACDDEPSRFKIIHIFIPEFLNADRFPNSAMIFVLVIFAT